MRIGSNTAAAKTNKMTTLNITPANAAAYTLAIARDNTGRPAAYVNNSADTSASGEEAILASFLEDARNSEGGEDALYAAIAAAK